MTTYETRTLKIAVLPKGEPLFSEEATTVEIMDEAAGEFLEIKQQSDRTENVSQAILVNDYEWPALRAAIDRMIKECRQHDDKVKQVEPHER